MKLIYLNVKFATIKNPNYRERIKLRIKNILLKAKSIHDVTGVSVFTFAQDLLQIL